MHEEITIILISIVLILIISFISYILYLIFQSPFQYPYFKYSFDVSGKRTPNIENFIDIFFNQGNFSIIQNHENEINQWKIECKQKIAKSKLKTYRTKQYQKSLDDKRAYIFCLTREQTRYRQKNYIRKPYKVIQTVDLFSCDYDFLFNRNEQLKKINYECTLKEYNSKNQRKLMTKNLRHEIVIRDKYTCQLCGKYMPDEVGLHIDHIIPISKGGKTVSYNLQVLCSKCNGNKSNK